MSQAFILQTVGAIDGWRARVQEAPRGPETQDTEPEGAGGRAWDEQQGPCWDLGAGGVGGTLAGPVCDQPPLWCTLTGFKMFQRNKHLQATGSHVTPRKASRSLQLLMGTGLSVQHSHHCG